MMLVALVMACKSISHNFYSDVFQISEMQTRFDFATFFLLLVSPEMRTMMAIFVVIFFANSAHGQV